MQEIPHTTMNNVSPLKKSDLHLDRYLDYFGLTQDPFALTADPAFMYLGAGHNEALAALELGVFDRRGLIVVVGEVGTGKTTLAKYILERSKDALNMAFVSTTTLSFEEILASALKGFGLRNLPEKKAELLELLEEFVAEKDAVGEITALLIDEAQNLSDAVLEEFRLLLNIETPKNKLLQIVLLGQPELHEKLQKKSVRHVAARIAVRATINPLSPAESRSYIEHRLVRAGGRLAIFSPAAVKMIIAHAKGIPREINVNCHNALLFAFGAGDRTVSKEVTAHAIESRQGEEPQFEDHRTKRWQLGLAIAAGVLSTLALGAFLGRLMTPTASPPTRAPTAESQLEIPETSQSLSPVVEPPREAIAAPAPPEPASDLPLTIVREPDGSYVVRVERGITLSNLMMGIYGRYDNELLAIVRRANPQIRDHDVLRVGQIVRLPKID